MKSKIEQNLMAAGFGTLELKIPGFSVCFTIENNFINAIVLVDVQRYPSISKEDFDLITKKIDWKSVNGESIDVHTLTLIFTTDTALARELSGDNHFCWYIHTGDKSLVVDEGKCEDFYGLRSQIEGYLVADDLQEKEEDCFESEEDLFREEEKIPREKERVFVNYSLISLNVAIFILCIFFGDFLYDKGIFDLGAVLEEGQWYRLLTSTFLHADVNHLVSNMLILYLLGEITERAFGHVKYFLMYIGSGLIASGASMLFSYMAGDYTQSLGASGAVFGVTGALLWIVLRNHGKQEFITIPKIIFLIGYSLYNGFIGTNIDNAAHVGGLMGGFFLAMVLYRKKKQKDSNLQES